MITLIKNFIADESGASAAEYAVILVVVGLAIYAGASLLSGAIGNAMTDTADCIDTPNATNCQ